MVGRAAGKILDFKAPKTQFYSLSDTNFSYNSDNNKANLYTTLYLVQVVYSQHTTCLGRYKHVLQNRNRPANNKKIRASTWLTKKESVFDAPPETHEIDPEIADSLEFIELVYDEMPTTEKVKLFFRHFPVR